MEETVEFTAMTPKNSPASPLETPVFRKSTDIQELVEKLQAAALDVVQNIEDTVPDYRENRLVFCTLPPRTMDARKCDNPDGWAECILRENMKEEIMSVPGFPKPLPEGMHLNYQILPSGRAGLGMFAMRDFKMGELVVAERPLLVCPRGLELRIPFSDVKTVDQVARETALMWERHLGIALDRMHPDDRQAFLKLSKNRQEPGSGPLMNILKTNGYSAPELDFGAKSVERYFAVVCKDLSRINHSCRPNVDTMFDKASFSVRLFAVRDVKKGEQLFFSYCLVLQSAAVRREQLEKYGFRCRCPSCMGNTGPSDEIRTQVTQQVKEISALNQGRLISKFAPTTKLIFVALQTLISMENEGLHVANEYGYMLMLLARLYYDSGEKTTALQYTRDAMAWYRGTEAKPMGDLTSQ